MLVIAVVIRILEAIAQAIESGLVVSKRYGLCFKPAVGPEWITENVIETFITTTPPALAHREWLIW